MTNYKDETVIVDDALDNSKPCAKVGSTKQPALHCEEAQLKKPPAEKKMETPKFADGSTFIEPAPIISVHKTDHTLH